MKYHTSPDGTKWGVVIQAPGSSNAMILFRHPDGSTSRLDRYNWVLNHGPESRSVTARQDPEQVLESLGDAEITRLFQRSMPVSRPDELTRAVSVQNASL
jgi:hypothetical protein